MTAMNRLHSARTSYGGRQLRNELRDFPEGQHFESQNEFSLREPWRQGTAAYLPTEELLLIDGAATSDAVVGREWLPSMLENTLFVIGSGTGLKNAGATLTMELPNVHTTNTLPNYITHKVREELLILEKVESSFALGVGAARANDLREAYSGTLRALDLLMKCAMWERVSQRLRELAVQDLPVTVGIGAMRFTSSVAQYVPGWRETLGELVEVARHQRVDVATAFRGLVETYETASSPPRKLSGRHRRNSYQQ